MDFAISDELNIEFFNMMSGEHYLTDEAVKRRYGLTNEEFIAIVRRYGIEIEKIIPLYSQKKFWEILSRKTEDERRKLIKYCMTMENLND